MILGRLRVVKRWYKLSLYLWASFDKVVIIFDFTF